MGFAFTFASMIELPPDVCVPRPYMRITVFTKTLGEASIGLREIKGGEGVAGKLSAFFSRGKTNTF